MNAFNHLSPQDQIDSAKYLASSFILLMIAFIIFLSAILMCLPRDTSVLRAGTLLLWSLLCADFLLDDRFPHHLMIFIWALGFCVALVWRPGSIEQSNACGNERKLK